MTAQSVDEVPELLKSSADHPTEGEANHGPSTGADNVALIPEVEVDIAGAEGAVDHQAELQVRFLELSAFEQQSLIACLVAKRLLPEGFVAGEFWRAPDPHRPDEAGKPISVNLLTGSWRNFGSGRRGHDLRSLISHITGLDEEQAEAALAAMTSELKGN